jgi:hypothetical protein
MLYIGQKVRTSKQVSKRDYERLKIAGIKPGTVGEIIDIVYVVKIGNCTVELEDSSIDYANDEKSTKDDPTVVVDYLKNLFGMK